MLLLVSFDEMVRERYGNFFGVMLLFAALFIACNVRVNYLIKEMRAKSSAIESIRFASEQGSVYDGGQSSELNQ